MLFTMLLTILLLLLVIVLFVLRSSDREDINRLLNEVTALKKALLAGAHAAPPPKQAENMPANAIPSPIEPNRRPAPDAPDAPPIAAAVEAAPAKSAPELRPKKEPSYLETLTAGKIFSWIGGFMLFLGVVFAVKYSFENNLISPGLRIISGVFFALIMIIASFIIKQDKYKTTADTLCGVGLAVLYGVIFSARYFYEVLPAGAAFILMGAVSMASFWLAVYRKTQYIGFLGVVTGFLTPLILSAGSKNYLMLFAYLGFINIGAVTAALKEKWDKVIITALCFTFMFQFVWFFPAFDPSKITDFCIIFASYSAAAAATAFWFKDSLSGVAKKAFGFYVLGGFFFIFLSDMALPLIILAFFMNLLLAALYYAEPRIYGPHFHVTNIVAFLLLARWLSSVNGKEQNGIILLTASLIFTALNTLAAMAKKGIKDNFSSAVPAAALLLLFFIPDISLWILYTFGFIFVALSVLTGLRGANAKAVYFALIVYGAFLLRGVFSGHGFGSFELFAGLLYIAAFLCLSVSVRKTMPENVEKLSICASLMPYIFLTAFITTNTSMKLLGLLFCAGVTALILAVSYFNKNKYGALCAAAGAFLPQAVFGVRAFGFNYYSALFLLLWVMFFAGPFLPRRGDEENPLYNWPACGLAAYTLLFLAFSTADYASLSFVTALITLAYGAAAFRFDKKEPVNYKAAFSLAATAWLALFVFINTQIAHLYSAGGGATLYFGARGNFAKTIAYTLSWGIYGMLTLFASLGIRVKYGIQAGIALVGIAVLKLFLSDVWQLSTLYRVIVFIAMAVILIAGSFLYQSFSTRQKKGGE